MAVAAAIEVGAGTAQPEIGALPSAHHAASTASFRAGWEPLIASLTKPSDLPNSTHIGALTEPASGAANQTSQNGAQDSVVNPLASPSDRGSTGAKTALIAPLVPNPAPTGDSTRLLLRPSLALAQPDPAVPPSALPAKPKPSFPGDDALGATTGKPLASTRDRSAADKPSPTAHLSLHMAPPVLSAEVVAPAPTPVPHPAASAPVGAKGKPASVAGVAPGVDSSADPSGPASTSALFGSARNSVASMENLPGASASPAGPGHLAERQPSPPSPSPTASGDTTGLTSPAADPQSDLAAASELLPDESFSAAGPAAASDAASPAALAGKPGARSSASSAIPGVAAPAELASPHPASGIQAASLLARDPAHTPALTAAQPEILSVSGSSPKDAFAALDAPASTLAPIWTHAGAQHAEAGYEDPALGWVSVRADLGAGNIHASLVPGSADAASVLSGHLAGLNSFLAGHHPGVSAVTVGAPESRWGDAQAGGAPAHDAQQGSGHAAQDRASAEPSRSQVQSPSPASSAAEPTLSPPPETITPPAALGPYGAHISVMA
jgi:hypothetical protein